MRIGTIEIVLIEAIILAITYWMDSYIGLLLSLIIAFISAAILIITLIAEFIERSKVPRSYFSALAAICVTAIVVLIFFSIAQREAFDWVN